MHKIHKGMNLPKHTRPVPSNVRPSGHSQWKDPLLLIQRPFGQTPGNTSHSLTSAEKWSKCGNKDVTNRKSRYSLTFRIVHSTCNTMWIITWAKLKYSTIQPLVFLDTGCENDYSLACPWPKRVPLPAALCLKGYWWPHENLHNGIKRRMGDSKLFPQSSILKHLLITLNIFIETLRFLKMINISKVWESMTILHTALEIYNIIWETLTFTGNTFNPGKTSWASCICENNRTILLHCKRKYICPKLKKQHNGI